MLGGVAILGVVAAFWMLAFSPKLKDLNTARTNVDEAKTSYETARQEAQQFAQARLEFSAAYTQMAKLGKAVPTHTDEPSLVYQLARAANRAGVEFRSLDLDTGDTGQQGGAAPPAPAPAPTGDAGNQAAGAPAAPAAPATASTSAGSGELLGSVPANAIATASAPTGAPTGSASLRVMHFNFEFSGPFTSLERLMRNIKRLTFTHRDQLQVAGRLLTIDGLTFDTDGNKVGMAVTAYLLPAGQGLFAGATPGGPAGVPGAAPQPAAAPSSTPAPPAATVRP